MASKEQQRFSNLLKNRYPYLVVIEDCRGFEKLVNKSGARYEVDIYLPQFAVGFEYQGDFHFRVIKNKFNDPDKSRRNDVIKYDMVREHKILAVVELFPQDLVGDMIDNICKRIENTIPTYSNRKSKQKKLMALYTFLKCGITDRKFKIDKFHGKVVFRDDNKKAIIIENMLYKRA